MTTFTYKDIEYTIVYIDPSAGSDGDGTSYSSPKQSFPSTIEEATCYLIRRTSYDYKAQLPTGNFSSVNNVWLMGMPTEDDFLEWNLIDSGVKTAWGSDTATYANVLIQPSTYENSNDYCFYTPYLTELNANRCYFFRNSDGPSASYYCNSMFRCTETAPNYIFKHCKFGYADNNVDSDTYLANTAAIDSDSSTYPQYKWSNYLYCSSLNKLVLNNCVINYRENQGGNENVGRKGVGFYVDYSIQELVINGSQFNLLASSEYDRTDASQRSCIFIGHTVDLTNTVQNVEVNYIYNSTDYILPFFLFCSNYVGQKLYVKNIEYNVKKLSEAAPSPRSDRNMYGYDIGMRLFGYKQYFIDNYIVNFNETGLGIPYGKTLHCETFWRQAPGPLNKSVKNIKMTYCQAKSNLICDSRIAEGYDTYAMYFGSDYGNTSDDNGAQTTDWRTAGSYDSPILDGIDIDCPWGASVELHHATMVNANLVGKLQVDYGCGVEVETLRNNYGARNGIYLYGMYNYLRVKNYTVNKSNALSKYTGNDPQVVQRFDNAHMLMANNLYIDESNAPMFNLAEATANRDQYRNCAFICPNMGAAGQYYQRNQHCYVQSWNAKRSTSSAAASYKFVNNNSYFGQYDSSYDVILGMEPYNGFQYTPTQTGPATLTFYIAVNDETGTMVNNDVLHTRFYIDVDTPHLVEEVIGGDDIYNTVKTYSIDCGALLDDNSTWSNDSSVVAKKIVMPLNIETTSQDLNIRVHYGWYDLEGYCYLDPNFSVTYPSA